MLGKEEEALDVGIPTYLHASFDSLGNSFSWPSHH